MFADWSVAMSAAHDDPIVVIPWQRDDSSAGYVDLRSAPESIVRIPEAITHSALVGLLRAWNAPAQPWHTLKCDVFPLDEEKLAELQFEADLNDAEAAQGFSSYIDVALNSAEAFSDFPAHENLLRALTKSAAAIEQPKAAAEFILRRCILKDENREGFCISIYITGLGASNEEAYIHWQQAVTALQLALPPAS